MREFSLFLILLHGFTLVHSGKLELHTRDGKVLVVGDDQCDSGAIFEHYYDFSCACVTGLWALYQESCEMAFALIGGTDGQCSPINFMIRKANLLSPANESLYHSSAVAFDKEFKSIGAKFSSEYGSHGTAYFGPPENPVIITTGIQSWRLPSKKKCMTPPKPKGGAVEYCIFNHATEEEYRMEAGCLSGDEELPPLTCVPYFQDADMEQADPKSCNFGKRIRVKRDDDDEDDGDNTTEDPIGDYNPIVDEEANWTPKVGWMDGGQDISTEPPQKPDSRPMGRTLIAAKKVESEDDDANGGGRPMGRTLTAAKKSEEEDDGDSPGKKPQGRVFLSAVQSLETQRLPFPFFNTSKMDENHNLSVTLTHPKMNSELWNYMTVRAQDLLSIRTPTKNTLDSPAFVFLDICKQIFQNVCPQHYVRKEHFDIAVGAFISLQRNHLQFVDSFVDFGTKERIETALRDCMENKTEPYPFIERTPNGKPCPGQDLIEHGQFQKFDTKIQAFMTAKYSGLMQEPIVETVWKLFVHAHSACYANFKNNLNDHHRFTTIMLNLFTNDISDIWLTGEPLKSDIYAGFLGDARDLIMSIDYCTVFSRMESDYPWDLPRPGKNGQTTRRKREATNKYKYECLHPMDARDICPSDTATGGWEDEDNASWDLDDDLSLQLDQPNDIL
ncbi:hypothetical protein Ocin01_19232 [Orchesella cincta]|uniref:Uncharacterized protein n=1 Tax=Orchesella cincta TaxID=48709 RepID=A0A1D2M3A7_ORCCI|nr:hypothetical protein Ocin01_19232 [Orchesella cincta]